VPPTAVHSQSAKRHISLLILPTVIRVDPYLLEPKSLAPHSASVSRGRPATAFDAVPLINHAVAGRLTDLRQYAEEPRTSRWSLFPRSGHLARPDVSQSTKRVLYIMNAWVGTKRFTVLIGTRSLRLLRLSIQRTTCPRGREGKLSLQNRIHTPRGVGYTIRTRGVSSNLGVSLGNGGTPRRADEEWVVSCGRVKRYQLVAQTEHDLKVHLAGQECKESGRVFRSVVSIMREQLLRALLHLESSYGARTWN